MISVFKMLFWSSMAFNTTGLMLKTNKQMGWCTLVIISGEAKLWCLLTRKHRLLNKIQASKWQKSDIWSDPVPSIPAHLTWTPAQTYVSTHRGPSMSYLLIILTNSICIWSFILKSVLWEYSFYPTVQINAILF